MLGSFVDRISYRSKLGHGFIPQIESFDCG
uniref:Uncharacterized protein n=1 Tax=Medicago truncatula TaxID=3880 RepID=I3S3N0_MEDTR|nr:unknown [Medicago truncatula]